MSRRTRLKTLPKQRFSISHHFAYNASSTHFPRAYSLMGKDISFPTSKLPNYKAEEFSYVGRLSDFQDSIKDREIQWDRIKKVSISVPGDKYQNSSGVTNFLVFAMSLCCFCLNFLLKSSFYRKKMYPKYSYSSYSHLCQIIRTYFLNVDILVINIQDNDINLMKINQFQQVLMESRIKKVVVRNLSYFMGAEGYEKWFENVRRKNGINFSFIWENFKVEGKQIEVRELEDEQDRLNDDIQYEQKC